MLQRLSSFLLLLVMAACNNTANTEQKLITDTTKQGSPIQSTEDLPYFNEATMTHAGPDAYQDTFSVQGKRYRIIHHQEKFDGIVQKMEQGVWKDIIVFENLGNQNDYRIEDDVNGDGYNDICLLWKWHMEVFFYDAAKQDFITESPNSFPYTWKRLDATNNLYCNEQSGKTADPITDLYTFKGREPYYLYRVFTKVAFMYDKLGPDSLFLYKCIDGDVDKLTLIKKWEDDPENPFDYETWWAAHYRELMK